MTKNNNLIPNKAPIETVYELKNYEIKKSSLSPAARGKVINKSGSGFISESKNDYGPCTSDYCSCSSYELRQQLMARQYELDSSLEKLREYDEKWENYRSAVNNFFLEMDESRNNPIRKAMDNPFTKVATSFIPMAGLMFEWKYDQGVKMDEEQIESKWREKLKSCYKAVCDKYNEIEGWYQQINLRCYGERRMK